jgi:UPF0755 protein
VTRVLVVVLLAIVLAGAAAGLVAVELHRPGPPIDRAVVLSIAEGERVDHIDGVLRHPRLFALWARLTGADRHVHWGDFLVTTPLSPLDLLARLTTRPDRLHTVTIPEGFSLREIVRTLAAAGFGAEESFACVLDDPDFLAAEDLPTGGAEGYLFPDTYAFPLATPPDRMLGAMVRRFRDVFTPELQVRALRVGLTPEEAVILASLVEEEAKRDDERPLIAAVFLNRLRHGMPLQSDPTVLYGRTSDDRTITRADLARPTPYNTYTIAGLPPTPITNPGRASLEAAVAPAAVDYLYFVARGDGSHEFSSTLAAHNAAVARLRHRERDAAEAR